MAFRIRDLQQLSEHQITDNSVFMVDQQDNTITGKLTYAELYKKLAAAFQPVTTVTKNSYIRIWPDGWCEQGGYVNTIITNNIQRIDFITPFKDDNVFVQATPAGTDLGDNGHQGIWLQPTIGFTISNTGFWYRNDLVKGERIYWEACGYINI